MESGEIRTRFGRCPYCRAMIYQDPEAVIYYCSKCRTPIRGKNLEATEENALSRLEILSADTASVFSDELDAFPKQQPPLFRNPNSCSNSTANIRDDTRVYSNGHDGKLRPSSRRTRRSACSDSFVLRYGVFMSSRSETTEEGFSSSPRSACGRTRRRSLAGIQDLEASTAGWSRPAPPPPSPLADPAFQRDLLRSLDALRGLIAAIEPPASTGERAAAARRGARFFRRLESSLVAQALPGQAEYPTARRNAGSSLRSSSASSTAGERRRKHHCRPVLGGAPFVVCGGCSELLQVPAATLLSRRKLARMRCGGCDEVLEVAAPAGVFGSASNHTSLMSSSALPESDDPGSCDGSVRGGGAQPLPLPLHRALGYSSPSPLLQSRRY
ncbi:unnamed protein product [Urochloa humidicola]